MWCSILKNIIEKAIFNGELYMKNSWFKRAISVVTVTATVMGGVVTIPAATNAEEEFPAQFDLREEGYVTPVKFQNPWQACWAFSGTAAAESSILSLLGMTNEQYKEANGGEDFDLSERHLAWFGEYPITALTDPAQAGEGLYTFGIETNPQQVYDNGGFNLVVSSLFSSGVGPVFESIFPYSGAEKLTCVQYAEKYPEKALPSAISYLEATLFDDRSFDEVYQELKAQDYPFDENTPEWIRKIDDQGFFEGYTNLADITEEQFQDICFSCYMDVQKRTTGNSYYSGADDWTIPDVNELGDSNRDIYVGFTLTDGNTLPDLGLLDENGKWIGINQEGMNAVKSELMKGHGVSIAFCADTSKPGEAETGKYINLDTWAHYTYTEDQQNHAVCIVGWDDNYSADHFNEGHRPPGDGAWIVKNSWGSETDWYDNGTGGTINKNGWGVKNEQGQHTGYFYLSYYDKTVMNPETFVFDYDLGRDDGMFSVWSHDYMPSIISLDEDTSVHTTNVIKTANVFKNETDKPQKLNSVSTKTSSPDASVEYSIYRVDDNTTDPEDGTLLDRKNATYDYRGFHREKLDESIVIMPGETFSIVAEESAIIDGQKKYGCSVNTGGDEEISRQMGAPSYCAAVVNPGESFYYNAGKWTDWTQVIPDVKASIENGEHYAIDNFSIKAYMEEAYGM